MIRILLLGRTGNHLFQYALGRVLAETHDVPLVLDASWFNAEGWSAVSHFLKLPIRARVVRRCSLLARGLRRATGRHYWEYRGVPVLREPTDDQSFDSRFLHAPSDCMLFGYFQTPLYFESIGGKLRAELRDLIRQGACIDDRRQVDFLSEPEAIAVHVRRGDYLDHPHLQVCGMEYYDSAIRRMREMVPNARFYIFSDDPEWCKGRFTAGDQKVIDSKNDGGNPLYDLHLMSLASHHIITNSTYSWWAAWLGQHGSQHVLMPDRWYLHGVKAPIEEKAGGDTWAVIRQSAPTTHPDR